MATTTASHSLARTASPSRRRAPADQRDALVGLALVMPALLVVGAVLIFPVLFNLTIAMREWTWSMPAATPKPFVGAQHVIDLAQSARFWNAMRVSLALVLLGLLVQVVLGFGLALLLNQPIRGRQLFRAIFILPMVLAPIVIGIQWRYLLSGNFGLLNYLLARVGIIAPSWLSEPQWGVPVLVAIDAWTWTPFVALILLAGLQQVPRDLLDAAAVDGAGRMRQLRDVILPLLRPALAIVLVLRGAEIFRTFDVVYVLTGGGPGRTTEVLGLLLYHIAFGEGNLGLAAALAILVGLVGVVLGYAVIRFIRTDVRLV